MTTNRIRWKRYNELYKLYNHKNCYTQFSASNWEWKGLYQLYSQRKIYHVKKDSELGNEI